ncbi:MAG: SIMPL domain-containing protein [Pseudomonadota bacterium]
MNLRLLAASAAALTLLSACGRDVIMRDAPQVRSINVTGEAEAKAVPDIAMLNFSVRGRAVTSSDAFGEVSTSMNAVISVLKERGIEARDLQTNQISLNPVYFRDDKGRSDRNKIIAYEAYQGLTVRLRTIGEAGATIDAAVEAGANELNSFRMAIDDPKGLRDEARIAAVEDARAKAEAMAKAAGAKLGDVISLNTYNDGARPQPMAIRAMAMESADAGPSIEAGEQTVRVTVNAVFELQ